jgi:3-phenylpropionate/trans-cinnamate dioxygenase ferredoxin component
MNAVTVSETEIGKVADLKSGQMKMVLVQGKEILLARAGDIFYAADNRCRHMGGRLSKGKLEGTIVTCPLHGSQYDLKDGQVVRWTNWPSALAAIDQMRSRKRPLSVYQVIIEGDVLKIRL